jgi:hypothetical protein
MALCRSKREIASLHQLSTKMLLWKQPNRATDIYLAFSATYKG